MGESRVTSSDRRQTPRTKLVEIAYIGMGPENGGLVLDVSDGGLSFHSVAPVQPSETVRFLLSLRGHSRIEGAGEVVWTNKSGTVCGLRFTSLSSGAREHIYSWVNQPPKPAVVPKKFPAPPAPVVPAASPVIRSEASPVFAIPPLARPALSTPETRKLWKEPLLLWTAYGIVAAALAVAAYTLGVRVGRSQIHATARPAAQIAAPPAAPSAAPSAVNVEQPAETPSFPTAPAPTASAGTDDRSAPSDASAAPASAPPAQKVTLQNASKTEDVSPAADQHTAAEDKSAPTPDERAELQLEAGKSELAAAQSYLNGANGARDSAKAARLLWAAVANGNSTAEVVLADLYVRGDGVAKNCEQGQILLKAAAKNGNADAGEKLKELDDKGCQ